MKNFIKRNIVFIYSLRQVIAALKVNKLKSMIPLFVILYIIGIVALFTFYVTPLAPFVYSLF